MDWMSHDSKMPHKTLKNIRGLWEMGSVAALAKWEMGSVAALAKWETDSVAALAKWEMGSAAASASAT